MILAIKLFLRTLMAPFLYFATIYALVISVFRKIDVGLVFLIFLLPQPNIHYKMHEYPYGWMVIDLLMLSIVLGVLIQKHRCGVGGHGALIILILVISYLSLWHASYNFFLRAPLSTEDNQFVIWKNYARVLFLYFLVTWAVNNEKLHKLVIFLMVVVMFIVAVKSYRSFSGGVDFSYDKRYGGPFEIAGLGSNHFGAFVATYSALVIGLLLQDQDKKRKVFYLLTLIFSLHPLFFTYSRGAYVGMIASLIFFGLVREKKILWLVLLLFFVWRVILPLSVIDRVRMTQAESGELENSAAGRLQLWNIAYDIFSQSPLMGVGFNGFALTMARDSEQIISDGIVLTDTHNYFVKVLCEQGMLGLFLLGLVFLRSFLSGWKLYRQAREPFASGVGLGLAGCTVTLLVVNCFGDRFSYLECGGYFWIMWALVDRGIIFYCPTGQVPPIAINKPKMLTV